MILSKNSLLLLKFNIGEEDWIIIYTGNLAFNPSAKPHPTAKEYQVLSVIFSHCIAINQFEILHGSSY